MIKKFFVTLIACSAFLVSCKNDDDSRIDKETKIPIEERNALDDKAIEQYLADHYFSPGDTINGKVVRVGIIMKYDTEEGNKDDKYPSLKSMAVQDPAGYWYAKNPYQKESSEGKTIKSNDDTKIHISFKANYFRATNDITSENNPTKKHYGVLGTYGQVTYDTGDGSPFSDPDFYYYIPNQEEAKNGVKREHIELKNFSVALKHFKTTERSLQDNFSFQGVIILPSRLAFARNNYFVGTGLTEYSSFRDASFIFNFEIPQIEDRVKK